MNNHLVAMILVLLVVVTVLLPLLYMSNPKKPHVVLVVAYLLVIVAITDLHPQMLMVSILLAILYVVVINVDTQKVAENFFGHFGRPVSDCSVYPTLDVIERIGSAFYPLTDSEELNAYGYGEPAAF